MSEKANSRIIGDVLEFLDWIMGQDERTRQQIFTLLKHHFDRFKADMCRMQAGENPLEPEENKKCAKEDDADRGRKGKEKGKKRRKKQKGHEIKLTKENILEEMIFNELLESPLANRKDDDLF